MRQILIAVSALLIIFLVVLGLVIFGPLKIWLPESSQRGAEIARDYFTGTLGSFGTGGTGVKLPSGTIITTKPTNSWSLPSRDGGVIAVVPFSAAGGAPSPATTT